MGILRKVGVTVATGAIVLLASTPASAATSDWLYSSQYVGVDGCYIYAHIGTNNVTADEQGSCPGSVGARAYYTPNGVNYYQSAWVYAADSAVAGQPTSVGINGYH